MMALPLPAKDFGTISAIVVGPILAVQISEYLCRRRDAHYRKVHIFRTLMANRAAQLTASNIEALNLVYFEFGTVAKSYLRKFWMAATGQAKRERDVIECWRLYLGHLNDASYSGAPWEAKRADLFTDLLYAVSVAVGYRSEKSQIKNGAYYPKAFSEAEAANLQSRTLLLEILAGRRQLPQFELGFRGKLALADSDSADHLPGSRGTDESRHLP